jgi:hypothetical protein
MYINISAEHGAPSRFTKDDSCTPSNRPSKPSEGAMPQRDNIELVQMRHAELPTCLQVQLQVSRWSLHDGVCGTI